MRIPLLSIAIFFTLLAVPAYADQAREDPLMVTSVCNEDKARVTAEKLFNYVGKYFDKFQNTKPIKDRVSMESLYDEGPKDEWHEATFKAFKATFIREHSGKRNLFELSTRSKAFVLPFGLRLGQSKEQVQNILGPPTAINSTSILFEMGGEALSDVFFDFEDNKLMEVRWSYGIPD